MTMPAFIFEHTQRSCILKNWFNEWCELSGFRTNTFTSCCYDMNCLGRFAHCSVRWIKKFPCTTSEKGCGIFVWFHAYVFKFIMFHLIYMHHLYSLVFLLYVVLMPFYVVWLKSSINKKTNSSDLCECMPGIYYMLIWTIVRQTAVIYGL